jgi:RNA polymerase sigma-70 factor (ECF subfamily)
LHDPALVGRAVHGSRAKIDLQEAALQERELCYQGIRVPVESITSPSGEGSSTLVGRLQLREPDAWKRFSDLYGPLVYSWARRAGLQDSDASDVMQEVFRAVALGIDDYRRVRLQDSFRGWLWGISQHKIINEFRRRATSPQTDDGAMESMASKVSSALGADLEEELGLVARRAIALLRTDFQPVTWQAFEQTVLQGRSAADVAGDLGISLGSVYTAKSRVLARLRHELGELL